MGDLIIANQNKQNDVINIKVSPEFHENIKQYAKLTHSNKSRLIKELIKNELEGKILTNDYIKLDNPFYFNWQDLLVNGEITATQIKPSIKLDYAFTVLKIPNNLDTFSEEFKTYCYDDHINLHRGIYQYYDLYKKEDEITAKINHLFFEYNTQENILKIELLNEEDIDKGLTWDIVNINKQSKFSNELSKANSLKTDFDWFNFKKKLSCVLCPTNDKFLLDLMAGEYSNIFEEDFIVEDNSSIIYYRIPSTPITSNYERLSEDTQKKLKWYDEYNERTKAIEDILFNPEMLEIVNRFRKE